MSGMEEQPGSVSAAAAPRRGAPIKKTFEEKEVEQLGTLVWYYILRKAKWHQYFPTGLRTDYKFCAPGFKKNEGQEGKTQFTGYMAIAQKYKELGDGAFRHHVGVLEEQQAPTDHPVAPAPAKEEQATPDKPAASAPATEVPAPAAVIPDKKRATAEVKELAVVNRHPKSPRVEEATPDKPAASAPATEVPAPAAVIPDKKRATAEVEELAAVYRHPKSPRVEEATPEEPQDSKPAARRVSNSPQLAGSAPIIIIQEEDANDGNEEDSKPPARNQSADVTANSPEQQAGAEKEEDSKPADRKQRTTAVTVNPSAQQQILWLFRNGDTKPVARNNAAATANTLPAVQHPIKQEEGRNGRNMAAATTSTPPNLEQSAKQEEGNHEATASSAVTIHAPPPLTEPRRTLFQRLQDLDTFFLGVPQAANYKQRLAALEQYTGVPIDVDAGLIERATGLETLKRRIFALQKDFYGANVGLQQQRANAMLENLELEVYNRVQSGSNTTIFKRVEQLE